MNNLTISNFDTFSKNLFLEVNMTLAQFKKIIKSLPKNTELVAQVNGIVFSLDDIIISVDKVKEQAASYGHSEKREFAFLIVHSMLHLFGYDHMTKEEAPVMEEKQRQILEAMNILR